MRHFKLNKTWFMLLGLFVTIMLFLLGKTEAAEGVALANTAIVSLTDAEKEGLSDDEQKMVLAIKKSTLQQITDSKKGLVTEAQLQKGIDELKEGLTKKELKALEDILKEQGVTLSSIKEKMESKPSAPKTVWGKLKEDMDTAQDKLKEIKANKSGSISFVLKAADVTSISGVGAADPSIVNDITAESALRLGDGEILTINRGTPFILNFVSTGNTESPALIWFEEMPKQGTFAITPEGTIKPLQQYFFKRRSADYRKAAGRTNITEEFDRDFPRLVSTIKRLMEIDCRNDMNNIILSDMVTQASSYNYTALNDQIDNADDYAAIGAAIAQVQTQYYTPNVLVLNPADQWRMRLQKGADGHYVMSPFNFNGSTYEFGRVVVDPNVAPGHFFIGDGKQYKVDLYGDIIVRIGYGTGDFEKNQYTMVVEQYFYNYISDARKAGMIYGSFAEVKAAIEKP